MSVFDASLSLAASVRHGFSPDRVGLLTSRAVLNGSRHAPTENVVLHFWDALLGELAIHPIVRFRKHIVRNGRLR